VLLGAAAELANSRWISSARLVLVGFGAEMAGLPGVRIVTSIDDVGVVEPGDVVLSMQPPGTLPERFPAGASLLSVGPVLGSRCRLIAGDDELEIESLGITVRPLGLTTDDVDGIAKLLEPVEDPDDDDPDDGGPPGGGGVDVGALGPDESDLAAEPADDAIPGCEIEVRVLGPVEIVGAERPLTRSKSVELVAYLTLHKDTVVDADRLREALWPGRPPGTTLYTTASVARSHLGKAADGTPHLPLLAGSERMYRVGGGVKSDYERFAELVRRAAGEPAADAMRTLREALSLVRGRPFEVAGRDWTWVFVEGYATLVENDIVAAAHTLARLCLDARDVAGVGWATRQGLRASRGNEQLFRDAMQSSELAGDLRGVETLFNELRHIAEEDGGTIDDLHPETLDLYARLMGERAAPLARTG
jgi:DNA-binding SARP family transcriptional activator